MKLGPTLEDFVRMGDPAAVWQETARLLRLMSAEADLRPVERAFTDVSDLFAGRCPGYRACNTEYHDLQHTTDTLLATVRLMHGACAEGMRFSDRELSLGTLAALFHDAGYIQESTDRSGTGAKHTARHVDRSIAFMRRYCGDRGFAPDFPDACASILGCTGLHVDIAGTRFESGNVEILGKMLGSGDLLGQMADRCYLEKLLFLFYEFQEGKIAGFKDEYSLLSNTIEFYEITRKRLEGELGGAHRFMRTHFKERWGIDRDIYAEVIARHIGYLKDNLGKNAGDYRPLFKRGGLVERLKKARGQSYC
ncbi:MAG: hypothetical protein HY748_14995 [Elusimicrobia bacterium]|nr:hypothetical protein [Elusimicrobiota bacterium]